jgi:hypothetical protein
MPRSRPSWAAQPAIALEASLAEGVKVKRTRRTIAALLAASALTVALAPAATANPSPPTNGGNGAGKSGQCTGANAERPASCQSQGGPGNQP